jgi:predicted Zn-dependent protease
MPELGPERDWDLFSIPAFMLIPSALIAYRALRPGHYPFQLLPVSVVGLTVMLSFALVNHDPQRSVSRYLDLLDNNEARNSFVELANLAVIAESEPELHSRTVEFARLAWEEPPRTARDSQYLALKLANYYVAAGDGQSARRFLQAYREVGPADISYYRTARQWAQQFGGPEEMVALASEIEQSFPQEPNAQLEAASIYIEAGREALAASPLQTALSLAPDNYQAQMMYATLLMRQGDLLRAAELLRQGLIRRPDDFRMRATLSAAYFYADSLPAAREQLEIARRLAASENELSELRELQALLESSGR